MLIKEITKFGDNLGQNLRVIFVDDGSRDRTAEMLSEACEKDPRMAMISLSRNFGHQTAVSAGLQHAEGDVVAVIDADLQDPPDIISEMIGKWRQGYDVVYGVRQNRKESWALRAAYACFYRILKKLSNVDIPLDAGDFSLMDRKVVDYIRTMPEHNRFIRGLRGWVGFKQYGLPYERSSRAAGEPKYNVSRLIKLALDGIISFSSIPLRIAAWIGLIAASVGFILLMWALVSALFLAKTPSGWASISVIMLFFGGVQLIVLGIIGEYVGRIFDEVKGRPNFIIARSGGWISLNESESQ